MQIGYVYKLFTQIKLLLSLLLCNFISMYKTVACLALNPSSGGKKNYNNEKITFKKKKKGN